MIGMQEIEPNLKHTLSVWWLIVWRAGLAAVIAGLTVGVAVGVVGYGLGWPKENVTKVAQALGYLIGFACNFFFLHSALRKQYKGFRIALISAPRPA